MSHRILQLILVFIPWMSIAQTFQIDTLFSSYLVGGKLNQLDSQTRKFSSPYLIYNTYDLNNSLLNPSTRFDLTHFKRDVLKFSALPHIGFYYAFGQQGVQDLKAEYQQKISKNWLLNAQVINEQYNGFQRNSALNNLNYEAVAMYEDSLFLSEIKISTFKKTIQWNGGLQTDSLLNDLPQDYIPVNKTAATSQWNTQNIGHKTNVWLNKEKKTSAFILENSINFRRYRYNEVGDIEALYGEVFIDSAETNDSLNIFKNENTLSYKFKKKFFDIQMGVLHRYMQSKAFEMNLDTNMIRSFLNFNLQKGVVSFNHKSTYDPIGNFQSWQFQNQLNVDGKSHKISIGNSIKRLPLDFNYRLYNGNSLYYIYHSSELQREDEIFISAYQKIKGLEIFSKAGYRFLGNTYQFIDSGWSNNEIPDFNILYFSISSKYESQKMMVQSTYQFNRVTEGIDFVPMHDFFIRFGLNVGLFKDKVLKSHIGADFHFLSSHKRLFFEPFPGTIDVQSIRNSPMLTSFYKMALFANFNVNQFRFFIRWDNIPYLWINPRTEIVNGIYFPQTQVKIGFTWDFWN